MEYSNLTLRLTKNEKEALEKMASFEGLKISTFVKRRLGVDTASNLPEIDDGISVRENNEHSFRNKKVHLTLSEDEYEQIKAEADRQQTTVSALIRAKTLSAKTIIHVDVFDEDIVNLENRIQPQLTRIFNIFRGFKLQKVIHDNQYDQIVKILNSIESDLRAITTRTYKERRSLRQSQLRNLKKTCDTAIKNKTSITAEQIIQNS